MSDKPLPPTEKRLRDAGEEGNVARSEVFTGLAAVVLASEALFVLLELSIDHWLALYEATFAVLAAPDRVAAGPRLLLHGIAFVSFVLGILAMISICAAVFGAWVCGGLSFAPKAIKPSFKRLNAARHVKSLFGEKNLAAIVLALTTAGVVGAAAGGLLRDRMPLVSAMIEWQSLSFDVRAGLSALRTFVRGLFAALFVPAVLSVIIAKRQHRRSLRMTHKELKDELKQTTGDALMRARQRASFTEAVFATPAPRREGGKRALIVNPEHIAVLLHYGGNEAQAPIVIDKAIDDDAMRMANEALLERVIVFRFRQLARHLYQHGELQVAIPADCYRAVAIVYRIVEEIEALTDRPNTPIDIDDGAFSL